MASGRACSGEAASASSTRTCADRRRPRILCTGIAVLDEVFRLDEFPRADAKVEAAEFLAVGGGCAANAAVAIARLGGDASFAGPLGGPPGQEPISDRILAGLAREGVDCAGCVRLDGVASGISAIFVNRRGARTIVAAVHSFCSAICVAVRACGSCSVVKDDVTPTCCSTPASS